MSQDPPLPPANSLGDLQISNEYNLTRPETIQHCADAAQIVRLESKPQVVRFDTYSIRVASPLDDVLYEADTQSFVYESLQSLLASDPSVPTVPRVYDCFSDGVGSQRIHYLVIERIDRPYVSNWIKGAKWELEPTRLEDACKAIAKALECLSSIPPPMGADIGKNRRQLCCNVGRKGARNRLTFI